VITTFLIQLVLGIVTALFSLLPAWTPDTSTVTSTSSGFGSFLGAFDGYLPERLIVGCLALLIAIKLAMFGWDALMFAYHLIPGKAT
jgi:hypothetical protein